uniref:Glucose-1-phosphate cytidylyltransferase n=1 Tax=Candidatus Kentrum sp. LFY TaxID=2126342 RepID=A0A450UPJ2_9GAMM|nr:MAG: glucose-1-phosphate cytidylyltransferase [Candidatus Kentron sp. LFY]
MGEILKAIILAGGLGTRISEESHLKPKPMIEIGGRPIIWHIMKHYGAHGINEFIICCGYKGYIIKEYFANYFLHMSDITIDLSNNDIEIHNQYAEPWKVTLVETGELTQTGGRIKRVREHIHGTFCLTYGDGVGDVNLTELIAFHRKQQTEMTVTAIQPEGRFGSIGIQGTRVSSFLEKPRGDGRWISGGFFVCEPALLDRIEGDETILEREPMESLIRDDQISAWKHDGFWAAMDTLRDKGRLEELWMQNQAPWKTWG